MPLGGVQRSSLCTVYCCARLKAFTAQQMHAVFRAQRTLHRKNLIDKATGKARAAVSYSEYYTGVKYEATFRGDLRADTAPYDASPSRPACGNLG